MYKSDLTISFSNYFYSSYTHIICSFVHKINMAQRQLYVCRCEFCHSGLQEKPTGPISYYLVIILSLILFNNILNELSYRNKYSIISQGPTL